MPLPAGTRIGLYEVIAPLGAGGMGEVYRARDTRLGRDVALKILPPAVADDPDRRQRFEREARTLASLNHPHIAAIYGVEDDGRVLVMELVEGPTLADRIAMGAMPADEAIQIAAQVANALEAAHDQNIIHRDLKPANVKVRADGSVKVLDFGLAKAVGLAGDDGSGSGSGATVTSPALTMAGVILGTAAYMSPEQARGRVVDRRADVWAFGCVLFEMLTGRRAFDADNITDVIAAVVTKEPDFDALPAGVPPHVRSLLGRCLAKDPRQRLRDMGDARLLLLDAAIPSASSAAGDALTSAGAGRTGRIRISAGPGALFLTIGVVAGAAAWAAYTTYRGNQTPTSAPVRLSVTFPPNLSVGSFRLSPDGTRLALRALDSATGDRQPRLYLRMLGSFDTELLAGTEGVQRYAFSPSGRSLAAVVRDATDGGKRLVKVPVDDTGPPIVLAHWDPAWFDSVTWLSEDELAVAKGDAREASMVRISARDSTVSQPVKIQLGREGILRMGNRALPGHGIFAQVDAFGERGYQTNIWFIDPATGAASSVVENAADPVYLNSGHLLFSRDDTIMAAPFDPVKRALTGEIVALVSGLRAPVGPAEFSVADEAGALAYAPAGGELDRGLVVVDVKGGVSPFVTARGRFAQDLELAPGGTRAALTVMTQGGTYEVWVADQSQGTVRRLIAEPKADMSRGLWSADGQAMVHVREGLDEHDGVHVVRFDGTGERRQLARATKDLFDPTDWLPDRAGLLATKSSNQRRDLIILPLNGPGNAPPRVLRATNHNEERAVVSPDGTLLAFASDETGQTEIHVAPLRDGTLGVPVPVSRGATVRSQWAGNRRLLYVDPAGVLMSVDITTAPALTASAPKALHDFEKLRLQRNGWDVMPDGRIVGIQRSPTEDALSSIRIVLNWLSEVRARLPR
jgi:hypothetical protein